MKILNTKNSEVKRDIDGKEIYLKYFLLPTRGIIFLAFYALLHFLYDWAPNVFFQAIAGINESVFEHMKIGFFAFLMFIGVDYLIHYLINGKKMENKTSFVFSRLIGLILIGWLLMFIWYMIPAIHNQEASSLAIELSLSMIVTFISGMTAMAIADNFGKFEFRLSFKLIIIALVVILVIFYVVFSFITPWLDVFVDPEFL